MQSGDTQTVISTSASLKAALASVHWYFINYTRPGQFDTCSESFRKAQGDQLLCALNQESEICPRTAGESSQLPETLW